MDTTGLIIFFTWFPVGALAAFLFGRTDSVFRDDEIKLILFVSGYLSLAFFVLFNFVLLFVNLIAFVLHIVWSIMETIRRDEEPEKRRTYRE